RQDIHNFAAIAHAYGLLVLDFGPGLGARFPEGDSAVSAVHVPNSLHYIGKAFDAVGPRMPEFAQYIHAHYPTVSQLYWCGPGAVNTTDGAPSPCGGGTGDHTDHVHLGQR